MFLRNILFPIISVTMFFGAVELVLAVSGVHPVLLTEDPLVGFAENIPQFTEATRADGSVFLRTANNKRGLFNYQEFPRDKHSNSYRIFCMGGSTTYGRPYFDGLSFCGWLREYLKAADPTRNWEVINAGGISFASYRVSKLMNELGQYQPDLFIVYSGQNEFLEERSYGTLANLPAWLINLNATLSGTRTYTAMKAMIDAVKSAALEEAPQRYRMSGEVDEILNHSVGPQNYHRDDALKRKIITHYRLNLMRMVMLARSSDAGIIFVKPAINIKDMSPFKSEHRDGLNEQELEEWEALYQRALGLFEAGDNSEALTVYREALAIDDRYADLHFRIGKALFRLGRYDAAEDAFRQAVEEDIAPLRILAPMQRIVEEIAAAENVPLIDFPRIIRKAYADNYDHAVFGKEYFPDHVHTNMEGYRLLGLALFDQLVKQGIARPAPSWSEARVDDVRQAVVARLDPWRSEGYTMLNLGKVFDWAGKFEEAYAAFMRALEILGPNPAIYDGLARSSYGQGKPDEAIRYLHEVLTVAPEASGVHKRLAVIYTKQGKTDAAISHCRAELEISSEDYSVHARLAKLLEYQGDDDAVLRHYRTALQLKPDYEYAHVELAHFLFRQHRYDEALAHAQEALRINPEQFRAYNTLGLVMKHQGKLEQAMHHFTKALQLEPEYTVAKENLLQAQAVYSKEGITATSRSRGSIITDLLQYPSF